MTLALICSYLAKIEHTAWSSSDYFLFDGFVDRIDMFDRKQITQGKMSYDQHQLHLHRLIERISGTHPYNSLSSDEGRRSSTRTPSIAYSALALSNCPSQAGPGQLQPHRVERKLSTWLRLGFMPSVIGEFFQITSQISVSSFARESGLLAQRFRRSSSQPFSDQGL